MEVYTSPYHHQTSEASGQGGKATGHYPTATNYAAYNNYPHLAATAGINRQTPTTTTPANSHSLYQHHTSAFQPLQDYNENKFIKPEPKTGSVEKYPPPPLYDASLAKCYPSAYPSGQNPYSHLTADICRSTSAYNHLTAAVAASNLYPPPHHEGYQPGSCYAAFPAASPVMAATAAGNQTLQNFYYNPHQVSSFARPLAAYPGTSLSPVDSVGNSSPLSDSQREESVVSSSSSQTPTTGKRRSTKRGRRTRKCQCSNCQLPELTEIDPKTGKPKQRKHNCHFPGRPSNLSDIDETFSNFSFRIWNNFKVNLN